MVQSPRNPKFGNGRYLPDAPRLDVPADRLMVQRAIAATLQTMTTGYAVTVDPTAPASLSSAALGGTAASVSFTPAGNIAATDVQAAIEELDTEKASVSHTHLPEEILAGGASDGDVLTLVGGVATWVTPAP